MTNLSLSKVDISKESIVLLGLTILSVVSPLAYHSVGMKGTMFLPIFLCLAIGSGVLSVKNLLILAVATPTLNMLLTGMPAFASYQKIVLEGIVFALLISGGKKLNTPFIINFIISFCIARMSSVLLIPFLDNVSLASVVSDFKTGLYGIVLNFAMAFVALNIFKKSSL